MMFKLMSREKKTYARIALVSAFILFGGFYAGFVGLKYILQGENWLSDPEFGFWVLGLGLIFARLHYKSMYRYDVKGLGKRWDIKETTVRLPFQNR